MSNVGWTVGLAATAALGAGTASWAVNHADKKDDTALKVAGYGLVGASALNGTLAVVYAGGGIKSGGFKGLAISLGISTAVAGCILGAAMLGHEVGKG